MIYFLCFNGNKNVDIKFSAHDMFLKSPLSGDVQNQKIGKSNNIIKIFGRKKTKGGLNKKRQQKNVKGHL